MTTMPASTIDARELRGNPRRQRKEEAIRLLFLAAAASSIGISLTIIISLFDNALTFLTNIELSSLWTDGWFPRRGLFDVKTLLVGTLLTTAIAMLIAAPLGLGAALFLSEYASPRVRRIVKPILEILASVPSVVIGFFALTWISPEIVQMINPAANRFNLLAAGVGIGLLSTPLVASVAEDALRAVPNSLREAAYGMGSRTMATTLRVVFPAAISGIVAALILAVSRAIGETMVVAIATGGSGGSLFTTDVFEPGQTLTAAMAALATGSDQVRGAGQAFNSLFFLGLSLFAVTLMLNVVGDTFVRRVRNRY
jgi:phosphate transport system permease protein